MGVTIADCLKLPSLRDAKVIAGHRGLTQEISTVSVLEYARVFAMADALFLGNELIISAFTSVADSVEAQCDAIRRLHEVGEAGLILYYVDFYLKTIDKKLIEIANELSFPLIIMPPSAYNLRYSEVITEVLEKIFEERKKEERFVPALMKQIGNMRERQRNISGVLRLLSDRIRCSLLLMNGNGRELGMETWPMTISEELSNQIRDIADIEMHFPTTFFHNGKKYEVQQGIFDTDTQGGLRLYAIDEEGKVSSNSMTQALEVLQTSYNIWRENLQKEEADDLIRIILNAQNDDVYQIAKRLKIDLRILRTMWVLYPKDIYSPAPDDISRAQKQILKEYLYNNRKTAVVDAFDKGVVAFMNDAKHLDMDEELAIGFMKEIKCSYPDTILVWCGGLDSILAAKQAYLLMEDHCSTARTIYPLRNILTYRELSFAETCFNLVHGDDAEKQRCLAVLAPVNGRKDEDVILETLMAYLIDANQNAADAAELIHVHESTIKYRLKKINRLLGYDISQMPATYNLYLTLAVKRLLARFPENLSESTKKRGKNCRS